MVKFIANLESELESRLLFLSLESDKPLKRAEESMLEINSTLKKLKSFVLRTKFPSDSEEIDFFKNRKPLILSKLIYHNEVYRIETRKPSGGEKMIRKYYQTELIKLKEFFEENVKDITAPEGIPDAPSAADMLEISRTLEAKKNISFRQGTRLDNGQVQLTYNEKIDGQAGETGQLRIPEQFYIGVKPFLGGDAFCVAVRFRYRIQEARLVMWFELVRPDKVLEEAYTTVRAKIQGSIGEVPMYEATI